MSGIKNGHKPKNKKPLARGLPQYLFAGLLITTTISTPLAFLKDRKSLAASMLLSKVEGAHASVGADYTSKYVSSTTILDELILQGFRAFSGY